MRSNPLVLLGLFVLVALLLQAAACPEMQTGTPEKTAARSQPLSSPTPPPIIEPIDDGNGVLYFEATDAQYRASLSAFYKSNPSKHCDLQGHTEQSRVYGVATSGFILHCHDIAVNAQDVTVP